MGIEENLAYFVSAARRGRFVIVFHCDSPLLFVGEHHFVIHRLHPSSSIFHHPNHVHRFVVLVSSNGRWRTNARRQVVKGVARSNRERAFIRGDSFIPCLHFVRVPMGRHTVLISGRAGN